MLVFAALLILEQNELPAELCLIAAGLALSQFVPFYSKWMFK